MKKHRRFLVACILVVIVSGLLFFAAPISAEEGVVQGEYGYGYGYSE